MPSSYTETSKECSIPSIAISSAIGPIGGFWPGRPQTAHWRDSRLICCLVDSERHLGHIVKAGDCWIAFDATHSNEDGTGLRSLGCCRDVTAAKRAVQEALKVNCGLDPTLQ